MSNKTKHKKGEKTNVKRSRVIDFRPLNTKSRKDDNAWNALKLYGDSDEEEQDYTPTVKKLTKRQEQKIARFKKERMRVMGFRILSIVRQTA